MKLLMLILFFPFSFEGENGRELLDTALEKCSRLESHGVVVSEIVEKEHMEYNLGGNTILWFSMVLIRK